MQDNKNFLGTEPVGKLLLKLSIPTVIAQLINMLYKKTVFTSATSRGKAAWHLPVWESVCPSS